MVWRACLCLSLLVSLAPACDDSVKSRREASAGREGGSNEGGALDDRLGDGPVAPGRDLLGDRTAPGKESATPPAGLAAKYPGDTGIDKDPAVVFTENFEEGSVGAVTARYESKKAAGLTLVADAPAKSTGKSSMRMTAGGSSPAATDLYKKLPTGYDELFVRYYVKYSAGAEWHHSGVWIGGYNPATDWPSPQAGLKPAGNDRFSVAIEPMGSGANPGPRLDFYNYWMKMHSWMDQPSGSTAYWGNTLVHQKGFRVTDDTWMCVEIQVKVNPNPASAAGAILAVWKDDVLVQRFTDAAPLGYWIKDKYCPVGADSNECTDYPPPAGTKMIPLDLQYRNDASLRLNYFWPQNYITSGAAGNVWYDDIVIATQYVGCIK